MDQLSELQMVPVTAEGLRGRLQYLLAVLIICLWFDFLDWRFSLFGLLILFGLSQLAVHSPSADATNTVTSGKYILTDVTASADAPQDIHQHPAVAFEQSSNELLVLTPPTPSASQLQLPEPNAIAERASDPKRQLAMVLYRRNVVSEVRMHQDAGALSLASPVGVASSSFSVLPLFLGESFLPPLTMPLVRSVDLRDTFVLLIRTLQQKSFACANPCHVEAVSSSVESPSSKDSTAVAESIGQTSQAAIAANADQKPRISVQILGAEDVPLQNEHDTVEEPIHSQAMLEENVALGGAPETREEPNDGLVFEKNDDALQNESELIEESNDGHALLEEDDALGTESETIEGLVDGHIVLEESEDAPQYQPKIIEEPIDGHELLEENDDALESAREAIKERIDSVVDDDNLQTEPEAVGEPMDGHVTVESVEDEIALQAEPDTIEEPIDGHASVENSTGTIEEYTDGHADVEGDVVRPTEPEAAQEPIDPKILVSTEIDGALQTEGNVIDTSADVQASIGAQNDRPARYESDTIEDLERYTDDHTSHNAESETISDVGQEIAENPLDDYFAIEGVSLESRAIRSEKDVEEGAPRIAPRLGAGLVAKLIVKVQAAKKPGNSLSQLHKAARDRRTVSKKVVSSAGRDSTVKYTNSSGVVSASDDNVAADGSAKADGGMLGLEIDGLSEEQIEGGGNVQASQQVGADNGVEPEGGMTGVEVQEPGTGTPSQQIADDSMVDPEQAMNGIEGEDQAGDGDEVLPDADSTEFRRADEGSEATTGCDAETAMELDYEMPDSVGDSEAVDEDAMELEEEGPRSEVTAASIPDSTDIESQRKRSRLNREKLQDEIRRLKNEIALRQTSTTAANSEEMVLDSGETLAQSIQQQAAPVSMPETGEVATSMPQGAVQHLISTNSVADLRNARLGKRAEARDVPEEVAVPPQAPRVTITENRGTPIPTPSISPPTSTPLSTTSPESDHSITTPASTPPSTVLSSPPTSPSPPNAASPTVFSTPGTAKGVPNPPKSQNRKRRCDSVDDSSDHSHPASEAENATMNPGAQNRPVSASPTLSPTRRVLLAKPVKRTRKVQADDQKALGSRTSPPPPPQATKPTASSPAESSKKVRTKGKDEDGAGSGGKEEVAPLSSIPDNRGQLEYMSQCLQVAGDEWERLGLENESEDENGDGEGKGEGEEEEEEEEL